MRDGVDHPLRNLRPAGRVEEHGWLAVDVLLQRRKLLTGPFTSNLRTTAE